MESYLKTKLKLILVAPHFSISQFYISVKIIFVVYIILLTDEDSHNKVIIIVFHSWISKRPFEWNKSHKITLIWNSYKIIWTCWECTSIFNKHFRRFIRKNINFRGITLTSLDYIPILCSNEVSYKRSNINISNPLTAQISNLVWVTSTKRPWK